MSRKRLIEEYLKVVLAKANTTYRRAKALGKAYLGHASYIKECECLYRHAAEHMTNEDLEA